MDKETKLKKLLSILTEWLNYSKLWNEVKVEVIAKTEVERVKYEPRKKQIGPKDTDVMEYIHTIQWIEAIPRTEFVKITYFNPKPGWEIKVLDQTIEFPVEDLDRRIEHYDSKVRNLKNKNNGESK